MRRLKLETRLTPLQCQERLAGLVRPRLKLFGGGPDDFPLVGSAREHGFGVRRNITYRNDFRLEARGTYVEDGSRTTIELTIAPPVLVVAFTAFWVLTTATVTWPIALDVGKQDPKGLLIGLFPLFGLLLFTVGQFGAKKEDAFLVDTLTRAFEAREV